jgi:cytosine/adenosine deaminase-related metal-dependent hydrolase
VKGQYLITAPWVMPRPATFIADGAVLVADQQIVRVCQADEISDSFLTATHIYLKDCLLMPGLINAHCHLELTSFSNLCPLPGTIDFIDWILSVITARKEAPAERFRNGLAAGQQLLLESGTTCVGDFRSPDFFQTDDSSGNKMRAIHFLEIISREESPGQDHLLELPGFNTFHETKQDSLIQIGIAPHSPYTVSLPLLSQLTSIAKKHQLPLSMHLGESTAESLFFRDSQGPIATKLYPFVGWQDFLPPAYGKDSIDILLQENLIHHLSAVHLGTARPDHFKEFARLAVKPILCPRSNHTLGNPLPDLEAMLDSGLRPALGTDSLASVESLSLWDEMRFVRKIFPDLPAEIIFTMATINGAAALGLQDVGQLAPGCQADIIAVQLQTSRHPPCLDEIIEHTDKQAVRMVMVGGEWKNKRLEFDETRIRL